MFKLYCCCKKMLLFRFRFSVEDQGGVNQEQTHVDTKFCTYYSIQILQLAKNVYDTI